MKTISISVRNKIAAVNGDVFIVNGNSDIKFCFSFDNEWSATEVKTAIFVTSDGSAYYAVIENNACMLPVMYNTAYIKVGVISSGIKTSTSAYVPCRTCVADEVINEADLNNNAYTQLVSLIENHRHDDYFTKDEALVIHSNFAYKRKTVTTLAANIALSELIDCNLENVNSVNFICSDGCVSNVLLQTAESGEISVQFTNVAGYAGDSCDSMGNNEIWEFNIMNNRCIGRRWSE